MTDPGTPASLSFNGHSAGLRYGVMCSGMVFQRWQAGALDQLREHGHHLVLLVINEQKAPEGGRFKKLLQKNRSTLLFSFLENRMFKPAARRPVDMQMNLEGVASVHCMVEKRGISEYFAEADIDSIRSHNLDFILRFGFNIIRGDILTAARFGVWSFHHGDEMVYRGGPPGFWEIYQGDPVNGAILQQLTDKLDAGIILEKGYLKTIMHSYRENLEQILTVSSTWPARAADKLAAILNGYDPREKLPPMMPSTTAAPVYRIPGNRRMLKFLVRLLRNRIRFYYRNLIAAENWNVGVILRPVGEVALGNEPLSDSEITWLKPLSRFEYLADPSGFIAGSALHILAEQYSYVTGKAFISEIVVDLGGGPGPDGAETPSWASKPARTLDGPHLSYPFVFIFNGMVYCLPESYQSSSVTLYRRDAPTGRFVTDRVLLSGVEAVDPTLIFFQDRWWLFFTERRYSNTHLFLYYAPELTGEFLAHPGNPVKTDIRSARPAGTPFIHENVLYRPAQDCSATYGGRIAVNRVLAISPVAFAEETVKFIEPVQGGRYPTGLHTLSAAGNHTLIDGKRYRVNEMFLFQQLRKRFSRKGSRNV